MTARELIDWTLRKSGWGTLADIEKTHWIDCQPDFATAHYLNGFNWPDKKFRFKPDWPKVPFARPFNLGPVGDMPALPDHWDVIETADDGTSVPARHVAVARLPQLDLQRDADLAGARGRPTVMIHPEDAAALAIADGDKVVLGNKRGEVRLHARLFDGVRRGVIISESIWPNASYEDGRGINTLTGADAIAPFGGAAFHDNKVWLRRAAA